MMTDQCAGRGSGHAMSARAEWLGTARSRMEKENIKREAEAFIDGCQVKNCATMQMKSSAWACTGSIDSC